MTYERFEDLPVWKKAMDLAEKVYTLTEGGQFKRKYSLRDQIAHAVLSVSNNVAEGFERGTTPELLAFLYIAWGSAGEVRSMLCFFERLPVFRDLKSQISNLKSLAEGVSRQLRGWADSLQNSEIKGQRYLTEKERTKYQNQKEQAEFEKLLQSYTKGKRE
ncbi:MAG TPA: four helix bundle protein [Syntrophorhabdaceae bacterium]|nr:four helix bundle protein [Syntrophorhabdaceae bacterium]HQM80652.1 four helix bundle protein [Syntrophorhabdaceae bacterium]